MDAGNLTITLRWLQNRVEQVTIQSTRPLHSHRLFIGKTPTQTLALLPLLFNVCGVAQSFAAITALSQALAIEENPQATLARQMLVNVEMLREHCWWLLIYRDKTQLLPFIQCLNQFKSALFIHGNAFSLNSHLHINFQQVDCLIQQLENNVDAIFSGQRLTFLALKHTADLAAWLKNNFSLPAALLNEWLKLQYQSLGRTQLSLLPVLNNDDLYNYLSQQNADELSRLPTWQGLCYESSCLNRQQSQPLIVELLQQYGNGLLTRLTSRLIELAQLPDVLRQNAMELRTGSFLQDCQSYNTTGLAQVQTSRGLLIHRVALAQGVLADYQIIAPTEWNFHPHGVAAVSLQTLTTNAESTLRQQATLLINAFDPCVGFTLNLNRPTAAHF